MIKLSIYVDTKITNSVWWLYSSIINKKITENSKGSWWNED